MTRRSGRALFGSVLTALAFAHGCGDHRIIGSRCSTLDCPEEPMVPDPSCSAVFVAQSADAAPDEILERCQLFTLDGLTAVGPRGQVYLTSVEVTTMPVSQDVDVQLVPKLEEFRDGPVDCRELAARALPWIPVMAARKAGDKWDFPAPLVTALGHRLLISRRFNNEGGDSPVPTGLSLRLSCTMERPAIVSQAFEFSTRKELSVGPGEHRDLDALCNFEKPVRVSRLYTRPSLYTRPNVITAFTVETLQDKDVWRASAMEWSREFAPLLEFGKNDGLHWRCDYANMSDMTFDVGGSATDSCSLYGLYQLPDGGEDDSPQRCTR